MQDILLFVNHHLMLFSALAVILVLLITLEGIKLKRGATRLSPARVTWLINHAKAVVIDIRTPDAFLTGHIAGAISLPAVELKTGLKKIEKFKAQPIVLTCATGTDSPASATFLTTQGFQVHILNGGIRAWREADLPLIKK
ncbi:MAG TPA: rhodanese-like domain-containing protein [Gammaproteobacteria bacterium]|nr:rhodanese-like domain-containing protein [Gammaproteobacteria bacterium]